MSFASENKENRQTYLRCLSLMISQKDRERVRKSPGPER